MHPILRHIREQAERDCTEILLIIAAKYDTRAELMAQDKQAFTAIMNKRLYKAFDHMVTPRREWTPESLRDHAQLFSSKSDWQKNDPASYQSAVRRGLV